MDLDKVKSWITTVSSAIVAVCVLLALFTEKLPITARIRNVITEVNSKLLKDTEKCVRDCVKEGADQVIVKLVIFRQNPDLARSKVYREALEQANKSKYIFSFEGSYITAANYMEEEYRLLSKSERYTIDKYFYEIKKSREEDSLSLIDMLLSDNAIARELSIDKSYDRKVGPEEDIICHITPYDKIGIIGAYISELKWKAMNKL